MLKNYLKVGLMVLIVLSMLVLLTGCGEKTVTSTYDSDDAKVSVSLTYPESEDYKWSTNDEDLRTSADKAILLTPNFKIAIQFDDLAVPKYEKDFSKYKENYVTEYEAEDFKVAGLEGFKWYYGGYNATVVSLPLESNPDDALKVYVYPKDGDWNKDSAVQLFNSDDVQNILKTIKIVAK